MINLHRPNYKNTNFVAEGGRRGEGVAITTVFLVLDLSFHKLKYSYNVTDIMPEMYNPY